jgi:hypothetical protein
MEFEIDPVQDRRVTRHRVEVSDLNQSVLGHGFFLVSFVRD